MKGDPPNAKHPGAGRETRVLMALGQSLTRMRPAQGYLHGIAFPDSYRPIVLRRLDRELVKKVKLNFFFVNGQEKVEHVDWRRFPKRPKRTRT